MSFIDFSWSNVKWRSDGVCVLRIDFMMMKLTVLRISQSFFQNCQRIIRLKTLNSESDPAALAKEVVEKCDIIHQSQLPEVQQIIFYLKKRHENGEHRLDSYLKFADWFHSTDNQENVVTKPTMRPSRSRSNISRQTSAVVKEIQSPSVDEKASICKIDEYIELLYEDLPERIRGSVLILQLARHPDNLEELAKNGI